MPRFLQALRSIALRRAAEKVVEEPPPPTAFSAAVALLTKLASIVEERVPASARSRLGSLLGDKSPSERVFLTSVLLAVVLFALVLPACETLLGGGDGEGEPAASSPRARAPGIAGVEVEGVPCPGAAAPSSCESSARSSTRSGGSCCSMETIAESEEEYELDEEDEEEGDECENEVEGKGGGSLFAEDEGVADKATEVLHGKKAASRTLTIHDRVSSRSQ